MRDDRTRHLAPPSDRGSRRRALHLAEGRLGQTQRSRPGQSTMERYVAYYRVSTRKQGGSGLGLEAQQAAVARFAPPESVTAAFVEIESGKRDDRPRLAA